MGKFDFTKIASEPIVASFGGTEFTFTVFELADWANLARKAMDKLNLQSIPTEQELIKYAIGVGKQDVLNIAAKNKKVRVDISGIRNSAGLQELVIEVLGLGGDPTYFPPSMNSDGQ